jgi:3-methyladenine DNA glycosylase/8-oxoguanine DNA glycosylase
MDRATRFLRGADPVLATLIDRVGALPTERRPGRPAPGEHYAGLVRTIVGQQLSTRARTLS